MAASFHAHALAIAAAACLALAATPGQAQNPATEPPAELTPPVRPNPPPVVQVRQYLVLGVTLVDAATVEAALRGMTGMRTVEELHRAAAAVQALYARAGYGAVVVYLPPQEVSSGVVTLQAIEGRLSAVRVEGAPPGLREADVRARLPALQEGTTPRLDALDVQLRMVNDNPARRMRLVLLPGQLPEQTEAEIAMVPGARRQLSLELDNTGTPATGRARVALGWRDADLTGHDDLLELRLQFTHEHPKRFASASVNVRRPLYAQGTMIDVYALVSDTRSANIPTVAGDLRFAGRGHLLGLRATRYLTRHEAWDPRLALGIEQRNQRNQCAIGNLPAAACGSAGGELAITPLSIEYSVNGAAEQPAALSVSLVQGLAVGGRHGDRAAFDAVRPGARPEFTLLRLQGNASQALGGSGWEATARLAAQVSAHALVPAMQFGAGGSESVRGYEEREVSADHGLALSLELAAPRRTHGVGPVPAVAWRPLFFVDAAALRNRGEAPCSGTALRCHLASAGLGLRLEAGALSIRLDIAHTLREAGTTPRDRTRAHLWLRVVH